MLKQFRKESGFTIIELLIVIAIIGILATLVLTNFQGAQAKGRDTVRKNDINSLYQKLEEYFNENGSYPSNALTAATFPGIDAGALLDSNNPAVTIASTFTTNATAPTLTPTKPAQYAYGAYGTACTSGGASGCEKYVLAAWLEKEAIYQKSSLN